MDKELRAIQKARKRADKFIAQMNRTYELPTDDIDVTVPINVACLIHGDRYPWYYVDRLYNMVTRNLSRAVDFHVYTESHREIPDHMIKHS